MASERIGLSHVGNFTVTLQQERSLSVHLIGAILSDCEHATSGAWPPTCHSFFRLTKTFVSVFEASRYNRSIHINSTLLAFYFIACVEVAATLRRRKAEVAASATGVDAEVNKNS